MKQYRVTKYNPAFRIDGKYTRNEWTSISDIGKNYDGETFTLSAYEKVESHYTLSVHVSAGALPAPLMSG